MHNHFPGIIRPLGIPPHALQCNYTVKEKKVIYWIWTDGLTNETKIYCEGRRYSSEWNKKLIREPAVQRRVSRFLGKARMGNSTARTVCTPLTSYYNKYTFNDKILRFILGLTPQGLERITCLEQAFTRSPAASDIRYRNYYRGAGIRHLGWHNYVFEHFYGWRTPKGWVVHHIDHNPFNNHPGNLMLMRVPDHMSLHGVGRRISEAQKTQISQGNRNAWVNRPVSFFACRCCGIKIASKGTRAPKVCSPKCSAYFTNRSQKLSSLKALLWAEASGESFPRPAPCGPGPVL